MWVWPALPKSRRRSNRSAAATPRLPLPVLRPIPPRSHSEAARIGRHALPLVTLPVPLASPAYVEGELGEHTKQPEHGRTFGQQQTHATGAQPVKTYGGERQHRSRPASLCANTLPAEGHHHHAHDPPQNHRSGRHAQLRRYPHRRPRSQRFRAAGMPVQSPVADRRRVREPEPQQRGRQDQARR
ncbi:protein of unknown function [Streptomyces sp. KY70]|nr:protein of unknown function [Streptomyces sp. KY70]